MQDFNGTICKTNVLETLRPKVGRVDEVRISNVSRSAAWINATYLSQTDNFITYGTEETGAFITNISDASDPVGYGFNVTINATVYGANLVNISIYYPNGSIVRENATMSSLGGDLYQYIFNYTWKLGLYNYTVWANSTGENYWNYSSSQFNLSAQVNVSTVNLTDPPTQVLKVVEEKTGIKLEGKERELALKVLRLGFKIARRMERMMEEVREKVS